MNIQEHNRIVKAFEKSRNWFGLEAYDLYRQMTIKDWNNIRTEEQWYYTSKEERLRIIRKYLRDKQNGR